MRSLYLVPFAALGGLLLSGQVYAETYWRPADPMVTHSAGRGQYGGGFIEMMMTGQDPTDYGRGGAVYNRPQRGA